MDKKFPFKNADLNSEKHSIHIDEINQLQMGTNNFMNTDSNTGTGHYQYGVNNGLNQGPPILYVDTINQLQLGTNNYMHISPNGGNDQYGQDYYNTSNSPEDEYDLETDGNYLESCDLNIDENVSRDIGKSVASKWYAFGASLNLTVDEINEIEDKVGEGEVSELAFQILEVWRKKREDPSNVTVAELSEILRNDDALKSFVYQAVKPHKPPMAIEGHQPLFVKDISHDKEDKKL